MRRLPALIALLFLTPVLSGCFGSGAPAATTNDPRPLLTPEQWLPLLSQPRFEGILEETVDIKSTDGETDLQIDLYHPEGSDEERPTILILSPYWAFGLYAKDLHDDVEGISLPWLVDHFTSRGYTVALGDMRGTRNSGGCFDFGGEGDQQDGYAMVEWIAAQPWSSGKVGMYGVSHVGMSQLATAVAAPPHLTTIVPIAAISSFYRYLYFDGTHYDLNMLTPPAYTAVATLPPTNVDDPAHFATVASQTACDGVRQNTKGMSQDGRFDDHWKERDYPTHAGNINTSVLLVHGFIDSNVKFDHADAMWHALQANNVTSWAYFGQWGHSEPNTDEWRDFVHRWFDHWLLEIDTGMLREDPVRLEDNKRDWHNGTAWPPAATSEAALYLSPGAAGWDAPAEDSETYLDVPQANRGYEPDGSYLEYWTDPVDADLHVSGTPRLVLHTASDKASTHWVVLVYDVAPDGTQELWDRGYLDSKQRNGLDQDHALTPGEAVVANVSFFPDHYILEEGHRLRILVKSSDSCGYLVQPIATQCGPTGIVSDTTGARNTVFYGGDEPTRLTLPLISD